MELDRFKKRAAEATDKVAKKAMDVGEKAADVLAEGAKATKEKAQQVHHDVLMAYYRPVFPEEFDSAEFDLPKMIVIADESERKDIEVVEGSIGWLSKAAGIEVLHLYFEAVSSCGLSFFPMVNCDAVYYIDAFDKKRFVNLSSYYEIMQKEKMTELSNIAHSLGAEECVVETYEVDKEIKLKKKKASLSAKTSIENDENDNELYEINLGVNADRHDKKLHERTMIFKHTFEGSNSPVKPDLRWYKNDPGIQSLIEMVFSGNPPKEYTVKIDCSTSLTMAVNRAAKLDASLKKLGASCNFTLESEANAESRKKLFFYVKFPERVKM